MRPGTHLIELQPYLYEQDANNAGCAPNHRHLLVGIKHQTHNKKLRLVCDTALADFRTVTNCTFECRRAIRETQIMVNLTEFTTLLERITAGRTSVGAYRCDTTRCAYI